MQEHELRYSCQLALPGFGEEAQEKIRDARVLIVGMGGLGCPAAQYLAAAGVGTLGIADNDVISISNLHRQILYYEDEAGQKKISVAAKKLSVQNPHMEIVQQDMRVNEENVMELISGYDIVLDTTDNFETHYLLNDACVLAGKPMVHGSIYQYEGQVAVWNMENGDGSRSSNYRDVFPEVNAMAIPDCADGGVLPTIAGIIGCIQANEAIKVVTGIGEVLKGRMLLFNAQSMQSTVIKIGAVTKTNITRLGNTSQIRTISKEKLDKRIGVCLVDVRTSEEHSNFNIGGRNIPLDTIENSWPSLAREKEIILYCASGKRSAQAAKWLIDKLPGATIYSLEGGVNSL
jgi:sulfur-carrier protein adenylyltransferase/sulfurtransferase